ncbi:hypothetical protein HMPREF0860_0167 [Treponema socranskii subsp. socranskii VPI DR56BR1116 = ATCC 35536]|uniref:Uncharacterized protein n=2 Tax=Treponema socranskii TaxID=53419 RepID=U1F9C4_TRESO|nr:hypothetical protein HMPREF1325_0689 [Treponema socranskii subsp. socranskii VPI DR56BR1116 = ATCC 35536]ERK02638.1 hypothetical protein HMPREF0860_0167 [Treponema socranskii subsp. socranskii VPI DR56BR1116 = ATCC 35536]
MKNTILKNKNRRTGRGFLYAALLFATLIVCTACPQYVSLGGGIDILPPSGEITYPDAGETPIRGSFVLKGTAKDDEGVQAVSIVFENIETKAKTRSFPAELSSPSAYSTSWTANINNESTETEAAPHELVKIYPIPDGEYTAIVTVTDSGGKTSNFTKNYKIDNTPPVFIVSRPSTVVEVTDPTTPQADGYGAIFSVVGQAGEKNTVEKLNVYVPGTPPIDMTNMFVGNNINAQVAVYTPTDALYGLQAQDKTKPIRSELYLYDNAREYTGDNASGEGNKADWYYLWDDIYTAVIAKGYTPEVISDYFAGKKGSDKDDHDKKIKALRGDTAALAALKTAMIKMSEKRSTFKLEPSKSPGFKVIGIKNLPGNSLNVSQASSLLFKSGNETAFSVELIRNKDNTPLVEGSGLAAYKASNIEIVLLKWNGTGTPEASFKNGTNLEEKSLVKFSELTDTSRITMEDGKLRVKCTFDTSWGEGKYAVKVKGTDTIGGDPHRFEAYDDSNTASGGFYIINFLAVGTGPRIRPIRPQGFKKANAKFVLAADVTGIDTTTGHVYCNIGANVNDSDIELKKASAAANDPRYEVEVEIVKESGKYVIKWKDPAGVSKQKELPVGFSDGTHIIHFLGKAGSGSTDTDKTDFTFDTKAPTVEITSPDLSRSQSGDFTMRGSVIDTPSGVKSIKYIVGKRDTNDITVKPSETSTEWKPLSLSGDTWAIGFTGTDNITQKAKAETLGKKVEGLAAGVELYDIPIFFLVEDKAGESTQKGNIDIILRIIRVDPNGDIPEVTVLTPEKDKVLGGTITISGTVSVPNPAAGQVGSVWIQITDKTKTGHPDQPDFDQSAMFGTTDWCPSGGKQLTSYTAGSPYWSQEINSGKEFNPPGDTPRTIWFRLRGKNTGGVEGQWTSPVKIKIDKTAPTITGMKVATSGNINTSVPSGPLNPENQTYVSNMWIKGDALYLCAELAHSAGIEMISISGNYTSPTSLVGDSQITGYKIHNQQCFVQNGNNYKMQIPLKTTASPGSNNGFTINITIKAKKLDPTASDLTASDSFSFKYDNSAPTAVFGTKIASSGTVQVSETSFTDPALIGKTNIDASTTKFFASGEDIAITGFDRSIGKVTLASAPAHPTKGYLIYSPIEYLRPDGTGKVGVFGAAYDVGAGVERVKVNYNNASATEITLEVPSGVQTDVGSGDVNFVTWKGVIDVGSFADGKGKIVITPIDRANNEHAPIEVPVKLKKNSLKISSVELGTDINRNGTIANAGETKTLALTYDADKPNGIDSEKYDWHGKADGDVFRFKNNKSQIKVGISGGNGTKKYTLKCLTNGQDVYGLTALPSDGIITLNAADFTKIGQSDDLSTTNPKKRKLLLTLWDSASGLTCGTDTWMAELELEVIVDTKDRIAPTNEIDPFKWVSETENSLYGNSRDNGHIEIGTGLPSTFNQVNGLMDKDDKVSGKISITGTAHDDQVITEIWAKIDGFTFTGGTPGTGADAGYTKLAAFTLGSFSDVGNFNAHGWHFSVVSSDFSVETGHTVKWRLDWNTAKITGVVGTDKTITIKVKDTNQANEVAKNRRVDIVPYITAVSRNSTYNTNRARSGAIPLLHGETGNTLTGFNFADGSGTSLKITEHKDGTGSSVAMDNLTLSGDKKSFTFTVPDTAKDGYLHLVVNGVDAVNNTNAYTASNMEDSSTYGTAKHSDDRLVHIWRVNKEDTFKGSKNAIYPAMSKGTGGTLYASFSNYSKSEVYYSNEFTGTSAVEVGGTGTTTLFTGYDPPEETDITVNGTEVNVLYAANYHGGTPYKWGIGVPGSPWNDTNPENAGGIYLYDKDAVNTDVGNYNNAKMYRFELFTYDNELQQFKNIRTVRSENNIYVVYYDRLTGAVKFSWVDDSKTPDTSLKALPWCVIDGNTDVTDTNGTVPDHPADSFTFVSPDGSTYASPYVLSASAFEDGLSVSHTVWESIAVATTTQGYPIVVYMDATTGRLRLARSTSKQPKSSSDWKIQSVLASSDPNGKLASNYINACIGTDGYLHIAFQNTKGQLVYVKSKDRSDTGSTKYTFEKSEVLDDSGMFIDMTMNDATPYISYVSRPNSYDAIRIAYKASMDFGNMGTDVEGWETMTAPLNERAANSRICIETKAKYFGTTEEMPVAVGFTTGSDYRAAFYVGK